MQLRISAFSLAVIEFHTQLSTPRFGNVPQFFYREAHCFELLIFLAHFCSELLTRVVSPFSKLCSQATSLFGMLKQLLARLIEQLVTFALSTQVCQPGVEIVQVEQKRHHVLTTHFKRLVSDSACLCPRLQRFEQGLSFVQMSL
jgi:hypothetical protein